VAARQRRVGVRSWKSPTPLVLNHIVTGLDVLTTRPVRTVVAFGDSITAGGGERATGAYPDMLATRLRDSPQGARGDVAVLNAGIGGNRLLADGLGPSGLSRFERDVLRQSGVTHVIVLLGTNDIGRTVFVAVPGAETPGAMPTAQRITDGPAQLVEQARAKGVKVLIGTVPPFKNTSTRTRTARPCASEVNRWIRGRQDVDGVIDFDAALRDPADPLAMNPLYDSGRPPAPQQGRAGRDGGGGRSAAVLGVSARKSGASGKS
jgi:lysophospholipase L1-like esterase